MAKTMDMDIMTTVMAIRIMEDTEATRPKNANVIAKMIIKATTKNKNVDHSINQIFQKFCVIKSYYSSDYMPYFMLQFLLHWINFTKKEKIQIGASLPRLSVTPVKVLRILSTLHKMRIYVREVKSRLVIFCFVRI